MPLSEGPRPVRPGPSAPAGPPHTRHTDHPSGGQTSAEQAAHGHALRQARITAGLSQRQVAAALGLARVNVSYWELGHARPPAARQRQLDALYHRADQAGQTLPLTLIPGGHPARTELTRMLDTLRGWADVQRANGTPPAPSPGNPGWAHGTAVSDARRAATLAREVRLHFGSNPGGSNPGGSDMLWPQLSRFGVTGLLARLGTDPYAPVSAFLPHPELGPCVLLNADLSPSRRQYETARLLGQALFQTQAGPALNFARPEPDHLTARRSSFTASFAGHLLLPTSSLRTAALTLPGREVTSEAQFRHLNAHFGVSAPLLLARLQQETLISQNLAALLPRLSGYLTSEPSLPDGPLGLRAYPAALLLNLARHLRAGELRLETAATLLDVPLSDLIALLAPPDRADESGIRAFAQQPAQPAQTNPAQSPTQKSPAQESPAQKNPAQTPCPASQPSPASPAQPAQRRSRRSQSR